MGRLGVWLGLVGIAISAWNLVGCSSQEVGAPTGSLRRLNQEVLNLPQGASLGDVKANLGEPVAETTVGSEATLNYHSWQLHFQEGELRQRIHETRSGRTSPSGPILDHKVLFRLKAWDDRASGEEDPWDP